MRKASQPRVRDMTTNHCLTAQSKDKSNSLIKMLYYTKKSLIKVF